MNKVLFYPDGTIAGVVKHETAPVQVININGESISLNSYKQAHPLLKHWTQTLGSRYARLAGLRAIGTPAPILEHSQHLVDDACEIVLQLRSIESEMFNYQVEMVGPAE